ncbi:MAG: PEP-CTERM sorting domain-containing protein, partial [Terriglobia bacterium]
PAALGQYSSYGLGVCDAAEIAGQGGCQSPNHAVDNSGHLDFILFEFNSSVDAVRVKLNTFGESLDTDATYYVGDLADTNLTGKTLTDLEALFTTGPVNDLTSDPGNRSLTLTGVSDGVTSVLIGADIDNPEFSPHDYFKVQKLSVDLGGGGGGGLGDVPEPGTLLLTGTVLAALGLLRLRRSQTRG